jgi:hypothetical protein
VSPYFSAIPTAETEIGLALEATRGVPATPTAWFKVMGPKYKPDLQLLPDETLQGSMVKTYDEIPGLRYDSHGWDQNLYLDSFPMLVRAELGSTDNITVAPANTTMTVASAAGATTITTAGAVATGSWIVIDTGVGVIETRQVLAGGTSPTFTYPLAFAHAQGATITGLTGHAFSLLNNSNSTGNQPPSYTISDYGGDTWRELAACQLDELSINISADALPKVTTTWFCNQALQPSTEAAVFSPTEAAPGWTTVCAVGGTQLGYVVSADTSLKRGVKNIPAITGNQNFYQHFAAELVATGKLTVLQDPSAVQLSSYESGTAESFDLTLFDVYQGMAINIHSTKFKYTTGEIDRSKEYVEVPLDIEFLPTSTDALAGGVSPVKITVANLTSQSY